MRYAKPADLFFPALKFTADLPIHGITALLALSSKTTLSAQEAEKAISVKEEEIAHLEELMADPDLYSDNKKAAEVQKAYQQAQDDLARLYEEWEEAEAALQEEA